MSVAKAYGQPPERQQAEPNLDHRYGRIAISAVVAALPYRSETKNSAYAPVETRD